MSKIIIKYVQYERIRARARETDDTVYGVDDSKGKLSANTTKPKSKNETAHLN